MKDNIIAIKSFDFSVRIVEICKTLQDKKEYIISKQLLRSGTSIGANINEGIHAHSKADFLFKLTISQKECAETLYWIKLLKATSYLSENEFSELNDMAGELLRILKSIIITTRTSLKSNS